MSRKWVKFNVFFEVFEDEDDDKLFDDVVESFLGVIDPACAHLGDGPIPPDHRCTRDWTAGACSVPALSEDDYTDEELDRVFDAQDETMCQSCGRPLPDREHDVIRVRLQVEE